jgi:hypothetical protein
MEPRQLSGARKRPSLLPFGIAVFVVAAIAAAAGIIPRLRARAALQIETRDLAIPSVTVINPPAKPSPGLCFPLR